MTCVLSRALVVGLLSAVAVVPVARAAPVPEAERIPVDLRRTTLVVRDIDKSLPLYRDALGLKVIYDQLIGGGKQADGSVKPPTVRLVLLRANDDFIGVLGLMQRLNLEQAPPPPEFRRAGPGGMILVFNLKDLEDRYPRIEAAPHVTIAERPHRIDYPAAGGGSIPVLFSAVWDADGNFIELNHLLGAPAGR